MILIFGGAYQGKITYAKEMLGVSEAEIFDCANGANTIDFSKRCIRHIESFTLYCAKNGIEAKEYFAKNKERWQDSVLVCRDISAGVVPMEPELREWREMTGRLANYLSREADTVVRMFCSIPQIIKGEAKSAE